MARAGAPFMARCEQNVCTQDMHVLFDAGDSLSVETSRAERRNQMPFKMDWVEAMLLGFRGGTSAT